MNNTSKPQSSQFQSLAPGVSQPQQPRQFPTTGPNHPPEHPAMARRVTAVGETVTPYRRSASQIHQRWQLYQQQQRVIRQHATVIQTQTASATQATPAPASVPQAHNTGWARTFNRHAHLDNRGSTVPSALRARLAGLHIVVIFRFDRDGNLHGYSYVWGGVVSGHGLFTI
ncbi:hypothetical protein NCS57_00840300 [Fusarium keratoplasticum]|uniref:Uncharacterized protein n=1 Tax=Fusarium keratoplasticum TaxID=1328300 RepID=A0ACC0QSY7_9HYPO|nr:hypothetical protein NCS57_00840300 [Fusarium keratoplasticum]KAI8666163.1 hypothetical protein NCS57_00840300 [Fusarium keratoplasticum]